MPEKYPAQSQQYSSDLGTRLKDIEEKQRLLKDRVIMIGENLVEEREKSFNEMQEMKKIIIELKNESIKMKEFLQRFSEQISELARKEELMILQRQFDMFKPRLK